MFEYYRISKTKENVCIFFRQRPNALQNKRRGEWSLLQNSKIKLKYRITWVFFGSNSNKLPVLMVHVRKQRIKNDTKCNQ